MDTSESDDASSCKTAVKPTQNHQTKSRATVVLPIHIAKQVPPPPPPSQLSERLFHALPLPFHLARTFVSVAVNVTQALAAHAIDGPVHHSWSWTTSAFHAAIKSVMVAHPPQSRHGLPLIRYATSFAFPLLPSCPVQIQSLFLDMEHPFLLDDAVRCAAQCMPSFSDTTPDSAATSNRRLHAEYLSLKAPQASQHQKTNKMILYLHGGAHIFMSPKTHRGITTAIVEATGGIPVLAVDYRLCPEHRFPSAIVDALAFYLALLPNNTKTNDARPWSFMANGQHQTKLTWSLDNSACINNSDLEIILMGDSSGACLVLQLLHVIRALALPVPESAVLLSPFIDHTCSMDSWRRNWDLDFMSLDYAGVKWALHVYSDNHDLTHPVVSPLFNTDFKGYPPILIQAGDSEVLTDDAIVLAHKLRSDGVCARLELFEGMFHVFQAFPMIGKHKTISMEQIARFILAKDASNRQPETVCV